MNFDPADLNDLSMLLIGGAAAFIAALWLSLVIWTARDIGKRTRDGFTRVLAVLVVLLLFLPGWLIYLILRPGITLEEEYQRALEEEALLRNIEDAATCPGCGRRVQPDWLVCPGCYTHLKKRCQECNQLMELPWNVCPYCGTPVPGARIIIPPADELMTEQNPIATAENGEFTPFSTLSNDQESRSPRGDIYHPFPYSENSEE